MHLPTRRTRTHALAPVALLLLALPSLAVVPGAQALDEGFSNHGLSALHGDHELTWDAAGADLGPNGTATLEAPWLRLRIVNVPTQHVGTERPVRVPLLYNGNTFTPETVYDEAVAGPVTFDVGQGRLRVLPEAGTLRMESVGDRLDLSLPGLFHAQDPDSPFPGFGPVHDELLYPAREPPYTQAVAAADAVFPLDHARLLLANATFTVDGREHHLPHARRNDTRSFEDPATGGHTTVYDNHVLIVHVPRGTLAGDGDWTVQAHRLSGAFEGHATWYGLEGELRVEEDRAVDPTVLEVFGAVDVRAELTSQSARWDVAGDEAVLRVDLAPLANVGAVAGSIGLLAILGSLLFLGRDLTSFLLGRWTPPRVASEPLGHPARRSILDAVHQHQPVRMPDLERHTGLPRGTLRYHVRILEATHVLERHSGGPRSTTFTLNSGSLRFRLDGGPVAASALGATSHPVRALVRESLRGQRLDQDGLLDALRLAGRPVARSTLSHHLAILVRAGAVHAGRDGRRKVYALAVDPTEAHRHQYRAFLGTKDLLRPAHLLGSEERDRDEYLEALAQARPDVDPRDTLHRMERWRLVEARGSRVRLAPFLQELLGEPT